MPRLSALVLSKPATEVGDPSGVGYEMKSVQGMGLRVCSGDIKDRRHRSKLGPPIRKERLD